VQLQGKPAHSDKEPGAGLGASHQEMDLPPACTSKPLMKQCHQMPSDDEIYHLYREQACQQQLQEGPGRCVKRGEPQVPKGAVLVAGLGH